MGGTAQVELRDVAEGVQRIEEGQQRTEELLREALELLRMNGMAGREVRPSDASRIQQATDLRRVQDMSRRVRSLPEAERRRRPEVVLAAAQLEYAVGNYDQAIPDFQAAATLASENPLAQAQAHYNAYRAALERHASRKTKTPEDYQLALRELMESARLAPDRYTPFDLHEYEPRQILGHGGFGVTIQCRELNADRDVAVKILLADDLERKMEDVLAEGRILAKLPHKNVVELKAVRFADPARKARPYFVMEYLDGFDTLADHVQKHGPLEPRDMVKIAPQIAEGLKAAHDKGVFHRDVKPANVMIQFDDEGEDFEDRRWSVKLIDFGLAVRRDLANPGYSTSSIAHAKSSIGVEVAGTINYSAPEQMDADFQQELSRKSPAEQQAVRVRSDIYGFGKTCIYALCGDTDFDHDEAERLLDWQKILGRCTKKRPPEQRPKDFAEVLGLLQTDGLYLPVLPEDAIDTSIGPRESLLIADDDEGPPPPSPDDHPTFNWTPLKAAGASVLPGLGHLLFVPSQRAKGITLLVVSALLLLPLLGLLWPGMLVAWVLLVASDAFISARKYHGMLSPGLTILGVPYSGMSRGKAVAVGLYGVGVIVAVQFVAGWLSRANTFPASAGEARPGPRFVGKWAKPDDAGSNLPYDGRHWRANYALTVTPTTLNWSYTEQVGRGPNNVNKSSRYKWVKPNGIQLLDAKSNGGVEQVITVRLDFISDQELLLVIEAAEKIKYDPFSYLQGEFRKK